jgi:hypothetical protein
VSESILEKVVRTTEVGAGGGGLLNTDQTDRFIDYMFDATVLMQPGEARRFRMRSNTADIDKVGVGKRLVRGATEAVDTGENAGATFTKISITTKKLRLDWELSSESLEDNIEGDDLEDHIARLMATQMGNDIEDLAINGDTASSDGTLKNFDGWYKLALAGAHIVDAGGDPLQLSTFNLALKAMPRNFMQKRTQLRFYTGSNSLQDYLYSFVQAGGDPWAGPNADAALRGPIRTEGSAGFIAGAPFGVTLKEVPLFAEDADGTYSGAAGDHGHLELTFPNNRIVGVKREITVYREFKPKKDSIEYTVYTRVGVQWEELDAVVIVRNIGTGGNA